MPHLVLEYSDNIIEKIDFSKLFVELHEVLVEVANASLDSCKSRVVPHRIYLIGDGDKKNAFVHLAILLAEGRLLNVRQEVGRRTLQVLRSTWEKVLNELNLQITVEVREFPKELYFKVPENTV